MNIEYFAPLAERYYLMASGSVAYVAAIVTAEQIAATTPNPAWREWATLLGLAHGSVCSWYADGRLVADQVDRDGYDLIYLLPADWRPGDPVPDVDPEDVF